MKVDLSLDFDALLAEAVKQWKLREERLEPISKAKYSHVLCGGNMSTDTYRKLEEDEIDVKLKYQVWVKKNLTERGIKLITRNCDSKPTALWIIVAGEEV